LEARVEQDPDAIAIECDHGDTPGAAALTYRQLNARANDLAHRLKREGVVPGDIVPVMAERSFALIIGIFAVVKAGAAYMPVLPDTPPERLRYMLANAAARVMVVQHQGMANVPFDGTVIAVEFTGTTTDERNPPVVAGPDDLAYVMYTSGSTGRPKGVMIEQRALVNRLQWMQEAYPIGADDVILQKTSIAFDVSVWELFWWAIAGARMCLLAPGAERNPIVLADTIRRHRVTVLHFVPSMLNVFLEYLNGKPDRVLRFLASVKQVFVSGEALSPAHVRKFNDIVRSQTGARLTNLYGPTEATVDVSHFDCPGEGDIERVPIGKPIRNISLYVISNGEHATPGSPGELCIAGVGLARGYLNDPAMTEQKFTRNPANPGERIYRTGDVARLLPDGNFEYLGREDHQIKIRGMRIELGEIENVMREYPDVADCVALVEHCSENVALIVAFVVGRTQFDPEGLKEYLRQRLPAYMIPNRFEMIESVPTTTSGKADRAALRNQAALAEPV
jgi:amino acid adenylation domain-containing protein